MNILYGYLTGKINGISLYFTTIGVFFFITEGVTAHWAGLIPTGQGRAR